MKIELTALEIVALLLEMTIQRDDCKITSDSSFLMIMSTLEHEIDIRSSKCLKVKQVVI